MTNEQGEFDFGASGSEEGYRSWRRSLDESRRVFEARWGIVLDRPVRVVLACFEEPVEGIVRLSQAGGANSAGPPKFVIKGIEFSPLDIESLVRLDE